MIRLRIAAKFNFIFDPPIRRTERAGIYFLPLWRFLLPGFRLWFGRVFLPGLIITCNASPLRSQRAIGSPLFPRLQSCQDYQDARRHGQRRHDAGLDRGFGKMRHGAPVGHQQPDADQQPDCCCGALRSARGQVWIPEWDPDRIAAGVALGRAGIV